MGFYTERGYDLEGAKQMMASEIEAWYGNACLDVFDCSVGGVNRRYYCDESAQIRMMNGRLSSNIPMSLMCGAVPNTPDTDPVYAWLDHTATECGKVHQAYLEFARNSTLTYQQLKTQLAGCTTVEQVDTMFAALWG